MAGGRAILFLVAVGMSWGVEVPKITLSDGREMPAIGLGTYLGFDKKGVIKPKGNETRDVLMAALDKGWRNFDTATVYGTEAVLGEALKAKIEDGTVTREDVFITTKLWNTHHQREQVAEALRESLRLLGINYVDLYLMHWPMGVHADYKFSDVDFMETWRGMEDMVKLGLAKSIGVSNFNKEQLERLLQESTIKPVALQIEVHPQIVQTELVEYAQAQGLVVIAYSPFGSLVSRYGMDLQPPKVDDPTLLVIARKYNKTTPQVVLRWLIDRNIVPIPKTQKVKRLDENLNVFDFKLEKGEIDTISSFDKKIRYTLPSFWQTHPYYPFEKVDNPIPDPFASQ